MQNWKTARKLQQMLHKVNPYVSYLRHAVDSMHSKNVIDIKLTILERNIGDSRTCSAPSVPEIAVLLPGEGYPERVANRHSAICQEWWCT